MISISKKTYLIACLMSLTLPAAAQLTDDFNGGLSTQWQGDIDAFEINEDAQLQLRAETAGTAYIYRPLGFPDSLSWSMDISLDFAPSNNNRLRIILAADSASYDQGKAYLLEIGENGSDDAVCLSYMADGVIHPIGEGTPGSVSQAFRLRAILEKNSDDEWKLSLKQESDNIPRQEFQVSFADKHLINMSYFGIECKFTSTNRDAFVFDNLEIKSLIKDTMPPQLIGLSAVSDSSISLIFNELLDTTKVLSHLQFVSTPELSASAILYDSVHGNEIHVLLDDKLNSCQEYLIEIMDIHDLEDNVKVVAGGKMRFFEKPEWGDIIINELLSDPYSGSFDFLEIKNPTAKDWLLKGLIIRNEDRNDETVIEDSIVIEAGDILVLTENPDDISKIYNVEHPEKLIQQKLPGFNNNSGNVSLIYLNREQFKKIDSFDYSSELHDAALIQTEGVSLERINPAAPANISDNWTSSPSEDFATPGSVNASNRGERIFARAMNAMEVLVSFSEQMDETQIQDIGKYHLEGINISDIYSDSSKPKELMLLLEEDLQSGQIYNLEIQELTSKCGKSISEQNVDLYLLENAEYGDLLINEILFNPFPDHFDFIELINVSNKYIVLKNLNLFNADNENTEALQHSFAIPPGQIIAFTEAPELLRQQYHPPETALIVQQKLPAFNNDAGNLTVRRKEMETYHLLDTFDYREDYHYSLLRDVEGVSLERISPEEKTNNPDNWYSGAETHHFATPGYKNSAFVDRSTENPDEVVFLNSKSFSPDNDGYNDVLIINYKLDKPGYVGNIEIFDGNGRFKLRLMTNELMGISGFKRWDGTDAQGRSMPLGIYIIKYVFFHPEGLLKSGKKVCVLANKLN